MQTFERLLIDLEGYARVEQEPKVEGRTVVMVLTPLSDRERQRVQGARPETPAEEPEEVS